MGYRKFSADHIFTGYKMLDEKSVLVTDEKGLVKEIISKRDAGGDIEEYNGIISPGFVNCHCHLELSHMKGKIPENTGMIPFLLTVMSMRNAAGDFIHQCILDAEEEMVRNGIVAVGDICNTADTISRKTNSDIYYHNFIEAIGFVESAAETRFNQNLQLYEQFVKNGQTVSIVPHAAYSVSEKLFSLINNFSERSLLSMHNQESDEENEFFINGTGALLELYKSLQINIDHYNPSGESSIKNSLVHFSPGHSLILVHNVVTGSDDLEWIAKNRNSLPELFWCFCPNANQYITGKIPDIHLFRRYEETIVIGTDSLSSNTELNILSELKTLQLNFPELKCGELLTWATSNGARALRIQNKFGDFAAGKKPGILLIENVDPNGSIKNASSRVLL